MGKYKSIWTGPQIDEGVGAARNPDTTPTADSDALITSDAVAKVQRGFAPIESDATASQAYAIGDLLVWGGILYKAKTAIAVNDSFTVGTNIEATTIADKLNNIDTEITSDTDTTLTGLLTGNGSKVGTKSLDTSSLTNDADHVPASIVVKSALNTVDESIAIRVSGNKTTYASGAATGQYVIVDGSTITGITDGLYKAAKAIPYNTVIDSTYLTAASGGGLNDLKSALMGKPNYSAASVLVENVNSFAWVADEDCYLFVGFRNLTGNAVGTAYITDANGNALIYCGAFSIDQSVVGNYQQDARYFVIPKGYGLSFTVTSGQIRMVTKVPCK